MENELRYLLDKIYELEGLVHLALKREDSTDDFLRLIARKAKEVSQLSEKHFKTEKENKESKNSEKSESFSYDEYTIDERTDTMPLIKEMEEGESVKKEDSSINGNKETKRGKLVFSINEKFRFRKELFDNSDEDFNNTLALVASMENFEEAEDYFINEEGLDPENAVVQEFMDVIKRYFK